MKKDTPRAARALSRLIFSSRRRSVPLEEVGECRLEGALYLEAGVRTLRIGEGLSTREREWLRDSINAALKEARGQLADPAR